MAQNLQERAVAGRRRLGDDDAIGRLLLGASAAQPDLQQRVVLQRAPLVARMGKSINQIALRTHVRYFAAMGRAWEIDALRRLYVDEGLSLSAIAERYGCAQRPQI